MINYGNNYYRILIDLFLGETCLRKFTGLYSQPISALVSRLQLIFIASFLYYPLLPFPSFLATISLGVDYLTWWNDPGFKSWGVWIPGHNTDGCCMCSFINKIKQENNRDIPVDHLSTKHIPPMFKRSLITSYWFITSNTRATPFLICCSLCMKTLIWSDNSLT